MIALPWLLSKDTPQASKALPILSAANEWAGMVACLSARRIEFG
jgi:hypothetical protein